MQEATAEQLVKLLKIINFWITFFGSLFIIVFVILGFLLFKVVTFVQSTQKSIENIQVKTSETLDVKDDLCSNSLLSSSGFCKK